MATLTNIAAFSRAPERMLLTAEGEASLSETIAAAASAHAVAAAQLRAAARSWRLHHLVGEEVAPLWAWGARWSQWARPSLGVLLPTRAEFFMWTVAPWT